MSSTGPSVHLLLDTGHAVFAGANLTNLARCYRDRISQVRAKDVRAAIRARARAEDWSSIKAVTEGVYTVPERGTYRLPRGVRTVRGLRRVDCD